MGPWYCMTPCQCGATDEVDIICENEDGRPESSARVECKACGRATAWGYAATVGDYGDMVGRVVAAWNDGELATDAAREVVGVA